MTEAFEPLNGRLLVRRDTAETQSPGGILLPDQAQKKAKRGTVVGVGGAYHRHGINVELIPQLEVGDVVIFSEWSGDEIKVNGETLMIIREDDVLAKQLRS